MSPALEEESIRTQAISTGIVNSLSPRTDCVASGYVNDIPAKFSHRYWSCSNSDL